MKSKRERGGFGGEKREEERRGDIERSTILEVSA